MRPRFSNKIVPYILVLPLFVFVAIFFLFPFAQTVSLSLNRVAPMLDRKIFVGLGNFVDLLTSSAYLHSLRISVLAVILVVGIGIPVSLGLAILANQAVPGIRFFQVAFIWPYAMAFAVVGAIWALLSDPMIGGLTYLISPLIGFELNWMESQTLALMLVCGAITWKNIGYNVIFLLAALQIIPEDIFEASALDGANAFRRFWNITIPHISSVIFFLLIMNFTYVFFEVFGLIHVWTQGGPGWGTNFLIYKLYLNSFTDLRFGFASAQSVLLFMIVMFFTWFQFRVIEQKIFYGG